MPKTASFASFTVFAGWDVLFTGLHSAILVYFCLILFICLINSASDISKFREDAVFRKNSISLSDIAPLSLSMLESARLSRNDANLASKSFLWVQGIIHGVFAVPTASDKASHVSISLICCMTVFAWVFWLDVGGRSHALKFAQSFSEYPFSFRVSFPCLSSFSTLPSNAISLSLNVFQILCVFGT